jgi:hypothetical protein
LVAVYLLDPGARKATATDESLIYDEGAHKGEDTEFYLKKGFRVVAVEATPEFCESISNRFPEYVQSGTLSVVILAAVSSETNFREHGSVHLRRSKSTRAYSVDMRSMGILDCSVAVQKHFQYGRQDPGEAVPS